MTKRENIDSNDSTMIAPVENIRHPIIAFIDVYSFIADRIRRLYTTFVQKIIAL